MDLVKTFMDGVSNIVDNIIAESGEDSNITKRSIINKLAERLSISSEDASTLYFRLNASKQGEDVVFNYNHIERIRSAQDAVLSMCRALSADDSIELSESCLSEIACMVAGTLASYGVKVHYPMVVIGGDGKQSVEEYCTKESSSRIIRRF